MNHRALFISFILLFGLPASGEDLLLYAPFDGGADAAIAGGDGHNRGGLGLNFVEGVRGQALVLQNDCRYAVPIPFGTTVA